MQIRKASLVVVAWLAFSACGRSPASASRDHAALQSVAQLQRGECVGNKNADNVVAAKDGQCLCYDPPWDAGVPPPNEHERDARPDFDGFFLCRANPGVPASSMLDPHHCPIAEPAPGDACSANDQMLRNGDCLYVGADMKSLSHTRCDAEHWRAVPQAEVDRERTMRQ